MIYIDSAVGSREFLSIIERAGGRAEVTNLPYGDFCFEGNGPDGSITVGVERKALHDMLHCIDDSRYAGYQLGGMKSMYRLNFLMVEGLWKPHEPEGYLMEGFKGGAAWTACRYRSRMSPYSKLFNYLLSVSLSGVIITLSRDHWQTAFNLVEMYNYFQKPWGAHTSLMEVQKFPLSNVCGKPSLVRRWASQLNEIGVNLSLAAEGVFSSGIRLATADETDWVRIKGISPRMARKIVREIRDDS